MTYSLFHRLGLSLLVSLALISPITDADLGWHLRYGDYFWQHLRILKSNQFSWQMPAYDWPNHSWGYDVIISPIFTAFGFTGLSILGAIIIGLAFFVTLSPTRSLENILFSVVFVLINHSLLNTGLKSNYFSLLFSVLVLKLMQSPPCWQMLPLVFLLWVNLHGQFSLGLLILVVYFFTSRRRPSYLILITSFLATLANPWGIDVWKTAINHLSPVTAQHIYEWMPWELSHPAMILYCVIALAGAVILFKKPNKIFIFNTLLFLLINFLALRSRRFIPLATLISYPILIALFKPLPKINPRLIVTLMILSLVIVGVFSYRRLIPAQSWHTYCASYLQCSPEAAAFLKSYSFQGKLINSYSLGSFLIYHLPQIPVFIDGRMTIWQDEAGNYPFMRYYHLIHAGNGSLEFLRQNQIELVILQPQFELSALLESSKWPIIFEDPAVRIFKNPTFL